MISYFRIDSDSLTSNFTSFIEDVSEKLEELIDENNNLSESVIDLENYNGILEDRIDELTSRLDQLERDSGKVVQ